MTGITLAVLDMAGTTVRDDGQVPAAFGAALARHGINVTPDAVNAVRGASKRRAIYDLLPAGSGRQALANEVFATFREELAVRYRSTVRPIEGAEEAFAWLRANGIRIALNTGFDRDTTAMLLAALGWNGGTADTVVCGDDVAEGRPAPNLILECMRRMGVSDGQQVANVGDTVLDLRAARAARVRYNIGVLSGAHNRDQLQAEPHTHLIESIADLRAVFGPV
jgi:phosphonatase-like hydrolase